MPDPDQTAPAPAGDAGASADARMIREGGRLSLLTMASRVLGLVREMTRAAFMGTGGLADAFTMAFMVPNLLRRLFAEGSIATAFIPTFKGYLVEGDREKASSFLSAAFTALLVLVLGATVLGIAAAPLVVRLFRSDPVETAILTRLMFPFLALISVAAFLQGILNSIGVFAPSGAAPIVFNVMFIAVPWLAAPFAANPARALAVGVLAGGLAQALWQLPATLRAGWRFGLVAPARAFRDPGVRRVLALVAPTIVGMAAYQLNELVCTAVASGAGTGVATSITFSLRLLELILGVFAVSAGTVLLPELSGLAARSDWKSFSARLGGTLDLIALLTIPVAAFSMVMGREIVVLLFKARAFGDESAAMTARAFLFHMAGLYFIAANRILAPAFYATGDTRSPTWAGILSFGLNIALAFALVGPLSGGGIALALSLASAANSLLLALLLRRRGIEDMGRTLASSVLYALRLALISAIAAAVLSRARPLIAALFSGYRGRLAEAGGPLLVGGLLYGALGLGFLALLRDPVAAGLARGLAGRGRRGKGRSSP